eukprot:TRINITY_DN1005_c0_g2_i2.p1 TRINITY_DN1005_c0_g2~~TRINITY_DN1005_c0_g2_i2.p1  ORF type:complete len:1171 (-),score=265.89 TRINITY_DN1005_c0_g2_i2:1914-5426(-)
MTTLYSTEPHYIRCIKPNSNKSAQVWEPQLVLRQLRYSGMLATIRIRTAGYPVRKSFEQFLRRFDALRVLGTNSAAEVPPTPRSDAKIAALRVVEALNFEKGSYQLGATKLFLRQREFYILEQKLDQLLDRQATRIQAVWRGHSAAKKYAAVKPAVIKIQTAMRRYLARKHYQEERLATVVLQAHARGWKARKELAKLKEERRLLDLPPPVPPPLPPVYIIDNESKVVAPLAEAPVDGAPTTPAIMMPPTAESAPTLTRTKSSSSVSPSTSRRAAAVVTPFGIQSMDAPPAAAVRHKMGQASRKRARALRLTLIPKVVLAMFEYIEKNSADQVGVFRVAANAAEVKALKKTMDEGKPLHLTNLVDVMIVPNLLKAYFREMPEPLMTFKAYPEWIVAAQIKQKSEKIAKMRSLISAMPDQNRALLHELVNFLVRISRSASVNKMTASNLAIVFAPNLLRPKVDSMESIMHAAHINHAIQVLIEDYIEVFEQEDEIEAEKVVPVSSLAEDEDLSLFQMVEYASNHFHTHWAGNMKKKKVDVKQLTMFSRDVLPTSLHKLSPDHTKEALENFKSVLKAMGDVSTKQPEIIQVQNILRRGIDIPELRDEIICQICKQLTNNPSAASRKRGWQLLAACVGCFVPSDAFLNYFRHFLQRSFTAPEDAQAARFCQHLTVRSYKNGARQLPVSVHEFESIKGFQAKTVELRLPNGEAQACDLHSTTVASDILEMLYDQLDMNDTDGFGLYLCYSHGEELALRSDVHIFDVANQLEVPAAKGNAEGGVWKYKLSDGSFVQIPNYHLLFKKRLFFSSPVEGVQPAVLSLVSHQLVQDVVSGRLPVPAEAFPKLLAHHLQSTYGDHNEERVRRLDLTHGFIPKQLGLKKAPEIWKNEATPIYKKLVAKSRAQCQVLYVELAAALPLYGHTLFLVARADAKPQHQELAVALQGITFLDPFSREPILRCSYANTQFRLDDSQRLAVIHSPPSTSETHTIHVTSPKASEIYQLITDYTNVLRSFCTKAVALASYDVSDPALLSFRQGDTISVQGRDMATGWLRGTAHGRHGWFPDDLVVLDLASAIAAVSLPSTSKSADAGVPGRCDSCDGDIPDVNDHHVVSALSKFYHLDHFCCYQCQTHLDPAQPFHDVDGEPHCASCAAEIQKLLALPRCQPVPNLASVV